MANLLLLTDWFAPGFKAGGPIQSAVNLAKALQNDLNIWVYTSNTDHNTTVPYSEVPSNQWVEFDQHIRVFYASPDQQNKKTLKKIIDEVQPDCIHLNSMFSKHFTIFPLWFMLQRQISARVVLSPRGMLKKSALQFNKTKKTIFLQLIKRLGVHKKLLFHATTPEEATEIKTVFGEQVSVGVVNNMPVPITAWAAKIVSERPKFIFVGRIHPIKGLALLLRQLKDVRSPLQLSIVGNKEDLDYWKTCQRIIAALPPHIQIEDLGEVPHDQLTEILRQHHFFVLLTQGENFGHAIFEALAGGLPVLISDQTPWRDLERQKVGWDLALSDHQGFVNATEMAARMDQNQYTEWSQSAWQFANDYIDQSNLKQKYLELFSQNV